MSAPTVAACGGCGLLAPCWESPLGPVCVACRPRVHHRMRFWCPRGHPMALWRRRTAGGHTYCAACSGRRTGVGHA